MEASQRFPAGHYYSPMYDAGELAERREQIWPAAPRETVGIDWRVSEQLALCREVFARQERVVFPREATGDETEYHALNGQFPALDAWILEGMLRHLQPARMIEVGSGFSSLMAARVNREHLGGSMHLTCIEPYPRAFLEGGVEGVTKLRVEKVQDTPLSTFEALGEGDVLFVDTSHTVKTGGDVVWIFNEILPRLARGVYVHIHDVFLPSDYPEEWVMDGWGWNEAYLVQAFLAFNSAFDVVLGAGYLCQRHSDALMTAFPGLAEYVDQGGASLWIRRRSR